MESSEIQLARLDERMRTMLERMAENQESHAEARQWMHRMDGTLHDVVTRVTSVESSLAKSAPTIEEFMAIKHKVIGAGLAGRWLWGGLGVLLGAMISLKEQWIKFLTNT